MSTSTVSVPRARAAAMASNATAAGSLVPVTHGTPSRSAQICSCSAAPARNVSAAANRTDRPPPARRAPSLASVVVLPTPFTPKTSMIVGATVARARAPPSGSVAPASAATTARSNAIRKSPSARASASRICSVASTPKSASSRIRSASVRSGAAVPAPNTRANRSHKVLFIREDLAGAATPIRPRTGRSRRRTATTAPAAPRS